MKKTIFPTGWDEQRVQRLLAYYEEQTEKEALAEDEAAFVEAVAFEDQSQTFMEIPYELVPVVREVIAKHCA